VEDALPGKVDMSDRYIVIRNWDRFQQKDVWRKSGGTPPWIKNYTALLHNDDYLGLSTAQRGLLHGLWLMYASTGLALNEDTSRRLLSTNKGESRHFLGNLDALNHAGFIDFCSGTVLEQRRDAFWNCSTLEVDKKRTEQTTPNPNPVLDQPNGHHSLHDVDFAAVLKDVPA